MREARAEGHRVSLAVVQSLWPVPARALTAALQGIERIVVPELNQGQYAREIRLLAGARKVIGINRVDGLLITPAQIREAL